MTRKARKIKRKRGESTEKVKGKRIAGDTRVTSVTQSVDIDRVSCR